MSELLQLFALATLCPECNSNNVEPHYLTEITSNGVGVGVTVKSLVSYSCNVCLTWFSPEEAVAK